MTARLEMIEKLLDEAKQCELVAKQCSDKASGLKQLALIPLPLESSLLWSSRVNNTLQSCWCGTKTNLRWKGEGKYSSQLHVGNK